MCIICHIEIYLNCFDYLITRYHVNEQTTLRASPRTRRKFYNYLVLMFNTAFVGTDSDMCNVHIYRFIASSVNQTMSSAAIIRMSISVLVPDFVTQVCVTVDNE